MNIILFSGKAEAGKTTAARIVKDQLEDLGYKVALVPYGQYVKDTAKMLFGWDGKKDEKGRQLLQHWGTDIVRAKDSQFWADTVVRLARVISEQFDYLLIDDCRFPNEIDCWYLCPEYYNHTTTIRINRPGWKNALTPEQREHPSETSLDFWRFDLAVSATNLQELKDAVAHDIIPKII